MTILLDSWLNPCAAKHDALRRLLCSHLLATPPDGHRAPASACALLIRVPQIPFEWACLALIRSVGGAAWPVRTQVQDQQQPHRHLLHLGSPLRPQVIISKVQDSLALLPGRPSLRGLTLLEIIPLCIFMFFDFCLLNCHTHVLVISPTHYYVTSRKIISWSYYFIILLQFHYSHIV